MSRTRLRREYHRLAVIQWRRVLYLLPLILVVALARRAPAATILGEIRYTPDIALDLSGTIVHRQDVAADDLSGVVTLVDVGALPSAAMVSAYGRLENGDELLSFDVDVELPGGLSARPGDVVRYDGATFALLFDAEANDLPRGVITDGLVAIGPMDILLSFDSPVSVGGVIASDRDAVRFHDGSFSIFFDGAAAGVALGLDLDALDLIPQNGDLLLSLDGSGALGGVVFDDEDVLEYSPGSGTLRSSRRDGTGERYFELINRLG